MVIVDLLTVVLGLSLQLTDRFLQLEYLAPSPRPEIIVGIKKTATASGCIISYLCSFLLQMSRAMLTTMVLHPSLEET